MKQLINKIKEIDNAPWQNSPLRLDLNRDQFTQLQAVILLHFEHHPFESPFFIFQNKEKEQTYLGLAELTEKSAHSLNFLVSHFESQSLADDCYTPSWVLASSHNHHWLQKQGPKAFPIDLEKTNLLQKESKNLHTLSIKEQTNSPNFTQWSEMLSQALQRLDIGPLEKIVLSRRTEIQVNARPGTQRGKWPLKKWIENFLEQQNSSFFFLASGIDKFDHEIFLSLSPERLFRLDQQRKTLEVDIIAGTRKRGATQHKDQQLADELLNDEKELREHDIVKEDVFFQLKDFGDLTLLKDKELIKLATVQHLAGLYQLKLAPDAPGDPFFWIQRLHPTPALGGRPQKMACQLIGELEKTKRGPFAAPMGVISSEFSDILVAIRCGKLAPHHSRLTFYAGAGIMPESSIEAEWKESARKMQALAAQLGIDLSAQVDNT